MMLFLAVHLIHLTAGDSLIIDAKLQVPSNYFWIYI